MYILLNIYCYFILKGLVYEQLFYTLGNRKKNIHVICYFMMLAFLLWSETKLMVSLRYACMMLIVAGAVNSKFGKLLLLNFSILERVFCITDYFLMGIEMKWN